MKKIILGNWKANVRLDILEDIKTSKENLEVCIAVPYLYISEIKQKYGLRFGIAAQDCSRFGEGAYTGEVPASLIKQCGASYVILGHLERRKYFDEDSTILSEKISQALNNGLRVV